MELKLENGKYIARNGGVATVKGAEELAQRITMKLAARRGKFWPMPDYGSRLYTLLQGVKPEDRKTAVREYVAEALADEQGISFDNISMEVSGDTLVLKLDFTYSGGTLQVETAIGEEI
ncbi:MAG: hypothetical protein Q4A83_01050 [Bacillota bacterium]|nr:hypothetical protein [Bacillota bacterium]